MPGSNKTFYASARDWMRRVDRKIADLAATPRTDEDRQKDNSTDCFITIWQTVDYVNQDLPPAARTAIAQTLGKVDLSLADLQAYMRDHCNDLAYCQQIANGSKHFGYHGRHKKYEDLTVSVTVSASVVDELSFKSPKVITANDRSHMIDVAARARDFLARFMDDWKIGV